MGVVLSRTEVEALLPDGHDVAHAPRPGQSDVAVPDWSVETLRQLELRLESAATELSGVMSERMVEAASDPQAVVSIEYLGLAPGARLPDSCETVGTWVIQGPRPRETGRIAIEASLAIGLVEGLLGAGGTGEPGRQLTGLERSLLTRAVELIAAVLVRVRNEHDGQQWQEARAELSVRAETALASADQRSDSVLAGFRWQLGDCHGLVHVELSTGFVVRLTESEQVDGAGGEIASDESSHGMTMLSVRMPVPGLNATSVEGLELGDVIMTGRSAESETDHANWDVCVDGFYRFNGHPGTFDRVRAVVLEPRDRAE